MRKVQTILNENIIHSKTDDHHTLQYIRMDACVELFLICKNCWALKGSKFFKGAVYKWCPPFFEICNPNATPSSLVTHFTKFYLWSNVTFWQTLIPPKWVTSFMDGPEDYFMRMYFHQANACDILIHFAARQDHLAYLFAMESVGMIFEYRRGVDF